MACSPAGAHRWSHYILVPLAFLAVAVATPRADAQSSSIPTDTKNATDVTPYRAAIEQVLTNIVKNLSNPAPDVQAKARLAIENETRIPGQSAPPTPAYLDFYTRTLNKLLDAIKNDPSPRVRLNAAIAVCSVAQIADNPNLKDAVLNAIQDKNDAVVLWGIKAAKFVIPAQLRGFGQFDPTLVKAIIEAVKTHKEGSIAGAIATEAYDALTLDINNNPVAFGKIPPATLKQMVTQLGPYVIQLLQVRIEMYRKGVPPSPRADAAATRFLSESSVWKNLTPQQQKDAMQAMSDLIALAGKQAVAANTLDRADLAVMISRAAKAMASLVSDAGKAALLPATTLGPQSTADQIKQTADAVLPAIRKEKGFDGLKDPPAVTGHEAAPPPASAPTTGPVAIPGAGNPLPPTPAPAPATPAAPAPAHPVPGAGGGTAPRTPPTPRTPPPAGARPAAPGVTTPPDAR